MSATSQVISAAPKELPRPNRMRAFFRNRVGLIGASMILLTVLVAVAAPLISPYDPYERVSVTIFDIYQAPSAVHPLGTDDAGGDILSKLLYGARVSIIVGFAAAFI
jgi:peptide/nickel transport system permease protein